MFFISGIPVPHLLVVQKTPTVQPVIFDRLMFSQGSVLGNAFKINTKKDGEIQEIVPVEAGGWLPIRSQPAGASPIKRMMRWSAIAASMSSRFQGGYVWAEL
jgi:hypothetical protein